MIDLILGAIRNARREKNFSQQLVANYLNITQSCYAKMEKGKVKINVDTLLKISEYLQIDLSNLFRSQFQADFQNNNLGLHNQQLDDAINDYLSFEKEEASDIKRIIINMKENNNQIATI